MEGLKVLLLIILVIVVALALWLLFHKPAVVPAATGGDEDEDYFVGGYTGGETYEPEGGDYSDADLNAFLGGVAKKAAAPKPAKKEKKEKKEVEEPKEPKEEKKDEAPKQENGQSGFRGHFVSERVVEKHDPNTGLVTTYRVSVRGSMKDTHRVLIKIKDITEGNVQEKDGRVRKLKLKGDGKGDYETKEKPEQNRGKFSDEEKETAVRLLHGALNSSMLDVPTREKIVALVTKKL